MKRALSGFLILYLGLPNTLLAQQPPDDEPSTPPPPQAAALTRAFEAGDEGDAGTIGSFAPDLFTGAASFALEVPVPPGRNGMAPNLELRYDQRAGVSWVGLGWSLTVGTIEVDPGRPLQGAGTRYYYRSSAGPHRLAPAPGSAEHPCPAASCYWQERDADRTRYQLVTAVGQPPYWTATDRSGRRYVFGKSASARVSSPADADLTIAWALESIEDTLGNAILFSHEVEAGHAYLKSIEYSAHRALPPLYVVDFLTEPTPPALVDLSYGFERRLTRRLSAITVTAGGHSHAAFQLHYRQGDSSGVDLLESFQELGADFVLTDGKVTGGTAYPPHRFGYDADVPHRLTPRTELPTDDGELYGRAWTDFDGDGDSDYCRQIGSRVICDLYDGDEVRRVRLPVQDIGYPNSRAWIDYNRDGRSDFCRIVGKRGRFRIRCSPSAGETLGPDYNSGVIGGEREQLARSWLDVNRDGAIDFCRATSDRDWPDEPTELDLLRNIGPGRLKCTLGTGEGFAGGELRLIGSDLEIGRNHGWSWIDVTGDRRPDFCRAIGKVFPIAPPPPWPPSEEPRTGRIACVVNGAGGFQGSIQGQGEIDLGELEGRTWTDVNGDGLGDYCRVRNDNTLTCTLSDRTSLRRDLQLRAPAGGRHGRAWVDIDGDGRAEYCRVRGMGAGTAATCVRPIRGGATDEMRVADWLAEPQPETRTWVDVDNDGFTDYCRREPIAAGGNRYVCMQRERPSLNLLRHYVAPFGVRTELGYAPARTTAGVPLVTLDRLATQTEWGTAQIHYVFSHARWDYANSEFAGFAQGETWRDTADANRPLRATTYFDQGLGDAGARGRRGLPLRIVVAEGVETVAETKIEYGSDPSPPFWTPVTRLESTSCERGRCRSRTLKYEHDRFANVVRETHAGSGSGASAQREIRRAFESNEDAWILGLPYAEELLDETGWLVARTEWLYDGASGCTAAESGGKRPSAGLLTTTRRWVDDQTYTTAGLGYGQAGQITCRRDARGGVTSFGYDAKESFVISIDGAQATDDGATAPPLRTYTELAGVNAPIGSGDRYGENVRSVSPRGTATLREFDPLGRLIEETRPGSGTLTVQFLDFGTSGQQRIVERHSSGSWSSTWLDSRGRPARVVEGSDGGGYTLTRDLHYDAWGRVSLETDPYREGEERRGRRAHYDAQGRPSMVVTPDGDTTRFCYAPGVEAVVYPGGRKVRRLFDSDGALIAVEELAGEHGSCDVGDGPVAATLVIARDVAGRASRVTDAEGRSWSFGYDLLGRALSLSTPDSGETRWRWDATGNVVAVDSSAGRWEMSYDAIGRLLTRQTQAAGLPTIVSSYTYDQAAGGLGLPFSAANGEVVVRAVAYDDAGRLLQVEKAIGERIFSFQRTFDDLGRLRQARSFDESLTEYEYDRFGLTAVRDQGDDLVRVASRDSHGRPTKLEYKGGVRRSIQYCDRAKGAPACYQKVDRGGTVLFEERLSFDAEGNVRGVQDPHRGNRLYSLDPLGRLVNEHRRGQERFWSYDAAGNRTFDSRHGDAVYEPGTSRLTGLGKLRLAYDAAGRVVRRGRFKLSYHADGRLGSIEGPRWRSEYAYDADGGLARISTHPRGWNALAHLLTLRSGKSVAYHPGFGVRCAGDECSRRIGAGAMRIASRDPHGLSLEFQDYRGSLVRTSGAREESYTYDAFGMPLGDAPVGASFAGYDLDPAWPGLYFAHSRFYDAEIGRFLTPDPLTALGASSQNANRYSYALNNPVTLIDPTGELPALIVAILVGAAIGAAAGGIMAAISGQNVWEGMLRGAFYGGLMGAVGYFAAPAMAGNLGPLVRVVGGAAAGWATAEVFGGDPAMGAVMGAVGATAGLATEGSGIEIFGDSQADPWANFANQLATDARNGAVRGLVLGTMMGMDPLEAAAYGALGGMVGGQVPNLIGHLYGFAFGVMSSGDMPTFGNGAWHYKIDNWGMRDRSAITLGNVIAYDDQVFGNQTYIDHELIHVGDWRHQGLGFAAGYLTSMPFVGLFDQQHVYYHNPYEPYHGHDVGQVPSGPFGGRW